MRIPPPVIALIALILMVLMSRAAPGLSIDFPGQWPIGGLLMASGFAIALSALRLFRQAGTTSTPLEPEKASSLVTDGIYRYTRNPMYVGLSLLVIGVGVGLGTLALIVVLPLFLRVITVRQILPEEAAMEHLFGQDYLDYKARVRRWL